MLANTAERSAVNASPTRLVQAMSLAIMLTNIGEEDQRGETSIEAGLDRGILKLAPFESLAAVRATSPSAPILAGFMAHNSICPRS